MKLKRRPIKRVSSINVQMQADGSHIIKSKDKRVKTDRHTDHIDKDRAGPPYDYMCLYDPEIEALIEMRKSAKTVKNHPKFPGYYKVSEKERATILSNRDNVMKDALPYEVPSEEVNDLFNTDYSKQGPDPLLYCAARMVHVYNEKTKKVQTAWKEDYE